MMDVDMSRDWSLEEAQGKGRVGTLSLQPRGLTVPITKRRNH